MSFIISLLWASERASARACFVRFFYQIVPKFKCLLKANEQSVLLALFFCARNCRIFLKFSDLFALTDVSHVFFSSRLKPYHSHSSRLICGHVKLTLIQYNTTSGYACFWLLHLFKNSLKYYYHSLDTIKPAMGREGKSEREKNYHFRYAQWEWYCLALALHTCHNCYLSISKEVLSMFSHRSFVNNKSKKTKWKKKHTQQNNNNNNNR